MIKNITLLAVALLFTACSEKLSDQDVKNIALLEELSKTCSYAKGYREANTYKEETFLLVLQKCI